MVRIRSNFQIPLDLTMSTEFSKLDRGVIVMSGNSDLYVNNTMVELLMNWEWISDEVPVTELEIAQSRLKRLILDYAIKANLDLDEVGFGIAMEGQTFNISLMNNQVSVRFNDKEVFHSDLRVLAMEFLSDILESNPKLEDRRNDS